jgi:mxaJ protein
LQIASALLVALASAGTQARELRVCADPNNLPFSNREEQGFENRIVQIVARELHAQVRYTWWAQRRGSLRETLQARLCDVIPGVASRVAAVATTHPYYRSAYVFVTRSQRALLLSGFDDPRLRALIVGVQMIGDDSSNTPPAHALARRGLVDNVRGYMLYGDYASNGPARVIVDDVARGVVDVAVVWGPLAGYYALRHGGALRLQLVSPLEDAGVLPMVFDVSMGVRREDRSLRAELDEALARRAAQVYYVLREYGVPLLQGDRLVSAPDGPFETRGRITSPDER